jgi:hypothetical protein
MKLSQLKQIIKEEIQNILNKNILKEVSENNFILTSHLNPIDPKLLNWLMPKTAKTTKQAEDRIEKYQGGPMTTTFEAFDVEWGRVSLLPNKPAYRLLLSNYSLNKDQLHIQNKRLAQMGINLPELENVNVTKLTIYDTNPEHKNIKEENLGQAYVNTSVFLKELYPAFATVDKKY